MNDTLDEDTLNDLLADIWERMANPKLADQMDWDYELLLNMSAIVLSLTARAHARTISDAEFRAAMVGLVEGRMHEIIARGGRP